MIYLVAGAVVGAVGGQVVQGTISQARQPESFLNQALKYLAIGIMILSILLGVYLVANWGFLKDGIGGILDTSIDLGDAVITVGSVLIPGGLGGVISFLNPFRRFQD